MARLDIRDKYPSGMEEYLSHNGWHFNKKMCEWAVSKMYKTSALGKREYITPLSKEHIDELLTKFSITLDNKIGYDYVYVANMAKADYMNSSIVDELHLAKFIKDYVDDKDGYDGLPFTRFYADCIGSGTPISWEDMI
mgnify:CR=1 FL=1